MKLTTTVRQGLRSLQGETAKHMDVEVTIKHPNAYAKLSTFGGQVKHKGEPGIPHFSARPPSRI